VELVLALGEPVLALGEPVLAPRVARLKLPYDPLPSPRPVSALVSLFGCNFTGGQILVVNFADFGEIWVRLSLVEYVIRIGFCGLDNYPVRSEIYPVHLHH